MNYEHDRAIFEAEQIGASNAYFEARPHLDSRHNRHMFEDGFHRAWTIKTREMIQEFTGGEFKAQIKLPDDL